MKIGGNGILIERIGGALKRFTITKLSTNLRIKRNEREKEHWECSF